MEKKRPIEKFSKISLNDRRNRVENPSLEDMQQKYKREEKIRNLTAQNR